ncbi:hypothetical protein PPSIR1_24044 [Plesiocystis pacifica SIR-1]|uniref:Uncharacterized protein n=1 Tax=Plesiocystis pacifica SIR-1 TaxID=391625 RepID=A6GCK3_9BACT|nr:hypothetical protein [Plesiocystis pacifica]EDM76460.1 hypothetical protein PPSIR1_24044 [Plesiocystis pacifica SIR-1]
MAKRPPRTPKDELDSSGLSRRARRQLSAEVQARVAQAWSEGRALILNANKPNYSEAFTIEAEQYTLLRRAILDAVEALADPSGEVLLRDVQVVVQDQLGSHERFPKGRMTNYTRYTKTDLEARGELERIPRSSPQRLRRTEPPQRSE